MKKTNGEIFVRERLIYVLSEILECTAKYTKEMVDYITNDGDLKTLFTEGLVDKTHLKRLEELDIEMDLLREVAIKGFENAFEPLKSVCKDTEDEWLLEVIDSFVESAKKEYKDEESN